MHTIRLQVYSNKAGLAHILVYECLDVVFQALCDAVAKTKIMTAEQVVRDEQGEGVRQLTTGNYRYHKYLVA